MDKSINMGDQEKTEPATRQAFNKRKRTPPPPAYEERDHVYSISKMSKTEKSEPIKLLKKLGAKISPGEYRIQIRLSLLYEPHHNEHGLSATLKVCLATHMHMIAPLRIW